MKKLGRKPIPASQRRVLLPSSTVAQETSRAIRRLMREEKVNLGRAVDLLVEPERLSQRMLDNSKTVMK